MGYLFSAAQLWHVVSIIVVVVVVVVAVSIVLRLVVLSMMMMLPAAAFSISTISASIVHILATMGHIVALIFCGHHGCGKQWQVMKQR